MSNSSSTANDILFYSAALIGSAAMLLGANAVYKISKKESEKEFTVDHAKQELGRSVIGMPAVVVPPRHIGNTDTKHLVASLPGVQNVEMLVGEDKIIDNTKVAKRHISANVETVMENGKLNAETGAKLYQQAGAALFRQAATAALAASHAEATDIGAIISISCTNATLPALTAQMLEDLGFNPQTQHLPVSQWGCAAGVGALKWADNFLQGEPTSNVLVLCCEINSSMFHADPGLGGLICSSLFGDGAGGVVIYGSKSKLLKSGPKRKAYRMTDALEYILPHTTHWMYYKTDLKGQHFMLSRDVRDSMDQAYPRMVKFMESVGQDPYDPKFSIVAHTGGPQILRHLLGLMYKSKPTEKASEPRMAFAQEHLGCPNEVWRTRGSFDVLRNFGNVASVTIMAGLRQQLIDVEAGVIPEGNLLILGCGPGMSVQIAYGDAVTIGGGDVSRTAEAAGICQIVPKVPAKVATMWPRPTDKNTFKSVFDFIVTKNDPKELFVALALARLGRSVIVVGEENFGQVTSKSTAEDSKSKAEGTGVVSVGQTVESELVGLDSVSVLSGYKFIGVDKTMSAGKEVNRVRLVFNETSTVHEVLTTAVLSEKQLTSPASAISGNASLEELEGYLQVRLSSV